MFLIIGSYVKQILEIVGSQIEIEKVFSLTEILLVLGDVIYNHKIYTN